MFVRGSTTIEISRESFPNRQNIYLHFTKEFLKIPAAIIYSYSKESPSDITRL